MQAAASSSGGISNLNESFGRKPSTTPAPMGQPAATGAHYITRGMEVRYISNPLQTCPEPICAHPSPLWLSIAFTRHSLNLKPCSPMLKALQWMGWWSREIRWLSYAAPLCFRRPLEQERTDSNRRSEFQSFSRIDCSRGTGGGRRMTEAFRLPLHGLWLC